MSYSKWVNSKSSAAERLSLRPKLSEEVFGALTKVWLFVWETNGQGLKSDFEVDQSFVLTQLFLMLM